LYPRPLGVALTNPRFREEGENGMPRRSILSATERESLLTLPDAKDELIRSTPSTTPT
jgi:hypothetical protein